jgi:hypothetical protein
MNGVIKDFFKNEWVKIVCFILVGVLSLGALGFGLSRLAYKPDNSDNNVDIETPDDDNDGDIETPDEPDDSDITAGATHFYIDFVPSNVLVGNKEVTLVYSYIPFSDSGNGVFIDWGDGVVELNSTVSGSDVPIFLKHSYEDYGYYDILLYLVSKDGKIHLGFDGGNGFDYSCVMFQKYFNVSVSSFVVGFVCGEDVYLIWNYAFDSFDGLLEVEFPLVSFVTLGASSFGNCWRLSVVVFRSLIPPIGLSGDVFEGSPSVANGFLFVYVPYEAIGFYVVMPYLGSAFFCLLSDLEE